MSQKSTAFRSTKIPASEFATDSKDKDKIEMAYMALEAAKTDAVAAERAAALAQAKGIVARQRANIAEVEILTLASTFDNRIASEKLCMIYKDKSEITFEVWSERILRNTFRAQTASMQQTADQMPEDEGLFEQDDQE